MTGKEFYHRQRSTEIRQPKLLSNQSQEVAVFSAGEL
jgi:hypothetical protein